MPYLANYTVFSFFQLLNEPELSVGIDPGMTLTLFPSSIGRDLNPRPSNCESSMLITRPDFRPAGFEILLKSSKYLKSDLLPFQEKKIFF